MFIGRTYDQNAGTGSPLDNILTQNQTSPLVVVWTGYSPDHITNMTLEYKVIYRKTYGGDNPIITIVDTTTKALTDADFYNTSRHIETLPDLPYQAELGAYEITATKRYYWDGEFRSVSEHATVACVPTCEAPEPPTIKTFVAFDTFVYNSVTGMRSNPDKVMLKWSVNNDNLKQCNQSISIDYDTICVDENGNITEETNRKTNIGMVYNNGAAYSVGEILNDMPNKKGCMGTFRINSFEIRDNDTFTLVPNVILLDNTINFGLIEPEETKQKLFIATTSTLVLDPDNGYLYMNLSAFTNLLDPQTRYSLKIEYDLLRKNLTNNTTETIYSHKFKELFFYCYSSHGTQGNASLGIQPENGYEYYLSIHSESIILIDGTAQDYDHNHTHLGGHVIKDIPIINNSSKQSFQLEDMTLTQEQIKDLFIDRFEDRKVKLFTEAFNGTLKDFKAILGRQEARKNKFLILTAKLSGKVAKDSTIQFIDDGLNVAEFSESNVFGFTPITNLFLDDIETGGNDNLIIQAAYVYAHTTDQYCHI